MHDVKPLLALPPPAAYALERLNAAGFEAYLVGGSVRDACLGREPLDFDITTQAIPDEIKAAFLGEKLLETGLKHGTLTLVKGGQQIQITTFRQDSTYSDSRHPDQVAFTRSLREDVLRRDFTINALAWHPRTGLIDHVGGVEDLNNRLIRAVGDAKTRMREDSLRVLRALRFSAKLGFAIEAGTLFAMMSEGERLLGVSAERVADELNQTLLAPYVAGALRDHPRVLFLALPELAPMLHTPQRTPFHAWDLWEHTLKTLEATDADLPLRWAALLHDSGKPAAATHDPDGTSHFKGHAAISAGITEEIMLRLKQPRALRELVVTLVRYHDDRIGPDNLKRSLNRLGPEAGLLMLKLQYADALTHAPHVAEKAHKILRLYDEAEEMIRSGSCLFIRDLAIDGQDLIAIGFKEGAGIGRTLNFLLDQVLSGYLENDREELLAQAREVLARP
jgi:tRNA nucleotidyltransferase (CCA-adding enzyme)